MGLNKNIRSQQWNFNFFYPIRPLSIFLTQWQENIVILQFKFVCNFFFKVRTGTQNIPMMMIGFQGFTILICITLLLRKTGNDLEFGLPVSCY